MSSQVTDNRFRLYVSGLDANVKIVDIRRLFESFGQIESVQLALDESKQRCRGFCHLTLCSQRDDAARRAAGNLTGTKWRGRTLRVEVAKPSYLQRLKQERAEQRALDAAAAAAAAAAADAEKKPPSTLDTGLPPKATPSFMRRRRFKQLVAPPQPQDNERGWRRVKGRLMPRLDIAPRVRGDEPLRLHPDDLVERLTFLSDGPLAPRRPPTSLLELEWHWDESKDTERRQREQQRAAYMARLRAEELVHREAEQRAAADAAAAAELAAAERATEQKNFDGDVPPPLDTDMQEDEHHEYDNGTNDNSNDNNFENDTIDERQHDDDAVDIVDEDNVMIDEQSSPTVDDAFVAPSLTADEANDALSLLANSNFTVRSLVISLNVFVP
jgi:hypothetical protein